MAKKFFSPFLDHTKGLKTKKQIHKKVDTGQ